MNAALTVKINTALIRRYLSEPNLKANVENNAKLKILDGTAVYDGCALSRIEFEKKTICYFSDDRIKGFAKQMQNIIKKQAVELGYTEEN